MARYAALDAAATALDADVLLGHTMDDQAETVLLGLGRGSGPRSIAGMRGQDGRYLRPFLGLRRAVTEQACHDLGLLPWADPHNADRAYRRVRLRQEVLPLLEDVLAGGVVEALARTAAQLRPDVDALDDLAASRSAALGRQPEVAALAGEPPALRARILRAWAADEGAGPLAAAHLAALDRLITEWHGQGPVDLPGGCQARRDSGRLSVVQTPGRER
jgi:tRNA(Ile)-lysidine synthase